jgi:hypothetical protein
MPGCRQRPSDSPKSGTKMATSFRGFGSDERCGLEQDLGFAASMTCTASDNFFASLTKIKMLQIVKLRLNTEQGKVELERDKNIQSLFSQADAFADLL